MKTPVTDAAVDQFVGQIRAGVPTGKVFPGKMSECDFTPIQREKIRKARAERKALRKSGKPSTAPVEKQPDPKLRVVPEPSASKALSKLSKMLYLQGGNCFYCGRPLIAGDASIERLNPKSRAAQAQKITKWFVTRS